MERTLAGVFNSLSSKKIMVIGDLMLDTYTQGQVKRISPEGPVPVLNVKKQNSLPGGAGNVLLNLLSLGMEVKVVGRIGEDNAGDTLKRALSLDNTDIEDLYIQKEYQTPVKNRLIADSQQLVRVDYEEKKDIGLDLESHIINKLPIMLDGIDVVAVSDYDKGFLSFNLLQTLIEEAKRRNIFLIVDPKGIDFTKYRGAAMLKPNFTEAQLASGYEEGTSLDLIAKELIKQTSVDHLLVTRSGKGMSLFLNDGLREDFCVKVKEVTDVTGAGDTVLATLSMAIANGLSIQKSILLANLAGGLAVEHLGCCTVSLSDLAQRLLHSDSQNKIFQEDHIFALKEVLKDVKYHLLTIEGMNSLSSKLFKSLQKLSSLNPKRKLVVYLKDDSVDHAFVDLLSSLSGIDFIVTNDQTIRLLVNYIAPEKVYYIQQDALTTQKKEINIF